MDEFDYATINLIVEGVNTYTIDLSLSLQYDIEGVVDGAYAHDRQASFLMLGVRYLSSLQGGESYTILPFATDEESVSAALEACGILALDTTVQTSYEITEETLEFTMGVSGVSVDAASLVAQLLENTQQGDYSDITCPLVEHTPDAVDVQAVYDAIYTEVVDATLDVAEDNSYTIVESVRGVSFDVTAATSTLSAAGEGSAVSIALDIEEPTIDTETLEECLFRDVLGSYTTSVSGTAARRSNVKLAAEKFSGIILLPGETFSYNEAVGERTEESGFLYAGAYLNGETVQAIGGGICQGSSTLYCAVLYANLEVVERRNHTYVSSYVPLGMDATVSWGGPDFKFCNDTDYPIMIVATYANDRLTVEILGTCVEAFSVKITSTTLSTISPTVEEIEDDTLEVGTEVVEDSGHTGYKVQTYRYVYDGDGNLISESSEAYSSYSMTKKVVRVGTKVTETEETTTDTEETTTDAED